MSDVNAAATLSLAISTGDAAKQLQELKTAYAALKGEFATGLQATGISKEAADQIQKLGQQVQTLQSNLKSMATEHQAQIAVLNSNYEKFEKARVAGQQKMADAARASTAAQSAYAANATKLLQERAAAAEFAAAAERRLAEATRANASAAQAASAASTVKLLQERAAAAEVAAAAERRLAEATRANASAAQAASAANTARLIQERAATASGTATRTYNPLMNTYTTTPAQVATAGALSQNMSQVATATGRATVEQHNWNKAAKDGHAFARGLSGSLGALWMTYGSLAPLLAGAALAGSMKEIFSTGKALEYQFTMISAISNGATVDIAKFNEAVAGTMFTPMEAAKGLRVLAQAGLSVQDATTALPSVLKLATVGETDMGTAALATTAIMHAFGLEVSDFGHIGDVFSKAAAISATSVTEMMQAMKQASAISNMFGVSLEETGAALATLANRGIEGSAAGTAITNMVREMASPATKKAAEAMAKFGIETTNADGTTKSLTENLEQLARVASTMSDGARTRWLEDMFNARGVKAANILLNDLEKMKTTMVELKQASDGLGFMNGASIKLSLSTEGMLKTLQSDFQNVLASVFTEIQPAVQSFIGTLSQAVNSSGFKEFLEGTARAVVTLTSAFVDHIDVIKNLGIAYLSFKGFTILEAGVSTVIAGFTLMNAAIAANTAKLGLFGGVVMSMGQGLALLLGPATLVTAAIAAVGYAAYTAHDMIYGMTQAQTESAEKARGFAEANRTIATEIDKGIEALQKDAVALAEQIRLMRMGKTEAEAYALSLRQIPLALAEGNVAKAKTAFMDAHAKLQAVPKVNFGAGVPFLDPFAAERNGAENLINATHRALLQANQAFREAQVASVKATTLAEENVRTRAHAATISAAQKQNERLLQIERDGQIASQVLAKGGLKDAEVKTLQAQVAMQKAASGLKPVLAGINGDAVATEAEVASLKVQIDSLKSNDYQHSSGGGGGGGAAAAAAAAARRRRANKDAERDEKATIASYTERQNAEIASLASRAQNKLISEEQNQAELAGIYAKYNDVIAEQYAAGTKRLKALEANAKADEKDALHAALTEMETAQAKFLADKELRLQQSKDRELGVIKATGEATKAFLEEQKAQVAAQIESINEAKAKLNMGPGESAAYDAGRKVDAEFRKKEADLKAQINNLRESLIAAQKQASGGDLSEDQIASVEGNKVLQDYLRQLQEVYDAREALKTQAMEAAEANSSYMRSFEFGWKNAYKAYAEEAANSASKARVVFQSASRAMEDAVTQFVTTGKVGWRDLASTVLSEAARVMASEAVSSMLGMATNFISGLFSGSSGAPDTSGIGTAMSLMSRSANGNVFSGAPGLHQYVNTVQDSPKVFSFDRLHKYAKGGVFAEAGPEAVMPLARDSNGRLGVRAQGGSGTDVAIYLTVNEAEGTTSAKSSGDANGAWAQFATRIKGMILEEMTNQKRPGGLLYA